MTTPPTFDDVADALAVLRRVPGVTDDTRLGSVPQISPPLFQLARDLHAQWSTNFPELPGIFAIALHAAAGRHGLQITADLGEPVGYTTLRPEGDRWRQPEQLGRATARDEYLGYARDAGDGSRAAVVYLLPEGGQS